MNLPEIVSKNHEQIYDELKGQPMHWLLPLVLNRWTDRKFKPKVIFEDETATLNLLGKYQTEKTPILLLANHVQYDDHNIVNAAVGQVPVLSKISRGNTETAAKSAYFKYAYDQKASLIENIKEMLRPKIYIMGAVRPAFRQQDIRNEAEYILQQYEIRQLDERLQSGHIDQNEYDSKRSEIALLDPWIRAGKAGLGLNDLFIHGFKKGHCVFQFPEATRNNGDWRTVQDLEAGAGKLSEVANRKGIYVPTLTFGIGYTHDDIYNKNGQLEFDSSGNRKRTLASIYDDSVVVTVGKIILPSDDRVKDLTERYRIALQENVDTSYKFIDERRAA
jgi:hypothetical protein